MTGLVSIAVGSTHLQQLSKPLPELLCYLGLKLEASACKGCFPRPKLLNLCDNSCFKPRAADAKSRLMAYYSKIFIFHFSAVKFLGQPTRMINRNIQKHHFKQQNGSETNKNSATHHCQRSSQLSIKTGFMSCHMPEQSRQIDLMRWDDHIYIRTGKPWALASQDTSIHWKETEVQPSQTSIYMMFQSSPAQKHFSYRKLVITDTALFCTVTYIPFVLKQIRLTLSNFT